MALKQSQILKMKTKGMSNGMTIGVAAIALVAILVVSGLMLGVVSLAPPGGSGSEGGTPTPADDNLNDAATLTINAYDLAADSQSSVSPTITVTNGDGQKVINDAASSNATTFVGDSLSLWGTGTTYYCDPLADVYVSKPSGQIAELDCYTGAAD